MKKLSQKTMEIDKLTSDLWGESVSSGPSSIEAPKIEGTSVEGVYQLPLKSTSTQESPRKAVPMMRRLKNEELNQDLINSYIQD